MPGLLLQYSPRDVYNADETGLYYRLTPDRTHTFNTDKVRGGKKSKERLTLLLCANMDGSDKKRLFVIGKAKTPRCFKNVRHLPVDYDANSSSWMTSELFSQWLKTWDKKLDRKILLFIDNCPAHPAVTGLANIRVAYLPPNTTSMIQPLDQGIINTFKGHYRRMICEKLLSAMDEGDDMINLESVAKRITVLDAITYAALAWNKMTKETISNCFRKAGFKSPQLPQIQLELLRCCDDSAGTSEVLGENDEVTEDVSDEDIVAKIKEKSQNAEESVLDDDGEDIVTASATPPELSYRKISSLFGELLQQVQLTGNIHHYQTLVDAQHAIVVASRPSKQKLITSFFRQST